MNTTEITRSDAASVGQLTQGRLLGQLVALREAIRVEASSILEAGAGECCSAKAGKSATNLAHYLALRRHDLRDLQQRLAELGLSSLGRSESHVLATLDQVIRVLTLVVAGDLPVLPPVPAAPTYEEGAALLEANALSLLGAQEAHRQARIMVTLPSEAAQDQGLVNQLLKQGMNCARINCAHDHPEVWRQMIANIRLAEDATGRHCAILMDLAGQKIRTGVLSPGAEVMHVKIHHDAYGQTIGPALIELYADKAGAPGLSRDHGIGIPEALHRHLRSGDRLEFCDARGRRRHIDIGLRIDALGWVGHMVQGAYIRAGTELEWQRASEAGKFTARGRFRVTSVPVHDAEVRVYAGDLLRLTQSTQAGGAAQRDASGTVVTPAHIACSHPEVIDQLKVGQKVWIDDGKIGAVVESRDDGGVTLRVTNARPHGSKLLGDKGINFPDTRLSLPCLTEKDLADLDFVCQHADLVGFSFVQTAADMQELIAELERCGGRHLGIVAKIETRHAVKNLPEIIFSALSRHRLGIMIARGDLAVELGGERLSEIQEEILWICEAAHVPAIWATQVLDSMAKKNITSRPELTDAAMSGRAECVMLNKGPYILQALKTLDDILRRMEAHQHKKGARLRALHW